MKNFIPRPFASEMHCRRAPCGTTKSEIAIVPKPFVSPELINTFVADNNSNIHFLSSRGAKHAMRFV